MLTTGKCIICCALFIMRYPCCAYGDELFKPRIAIIGGGIGGTTAAYEFTNLALERGLEFEMDLYEPDKIGGRLATTFMNGFEFEIGGSIIHTNNEYMKQFLDKFNLSKNTREGAENDITGFYDGEKFVYIDSQYSIITFSKLLWRYGMDFFTLDLTVLNSFISSFQRIYKLQAQKDTFNDIYSLLTSLDSQFPGLLNISVKNFLLSSGMSELFVKEVAYIATNVNYNQDTNIHALVGAIALAGCSPTELWSVQGGNKRIPQLLLSHSDARLVKKAVQSVVLLPNNQYGLLVDNNTYVYDYVIVACPIVDKSKYKLTFNDFPEPIFSRVDYQKTIATLVHGELNYVYFKCVLNLSCPHSILSVSEDLFFNSISLLYPVTPNKFYDRKVYKIFSKEVLTESQLSSLFSVRDSVTITRWYAYPKYNQFDKNLSFKLHDNLYYVNAIEWIGSAIEVSALSGVNAALSVFKSFKYQPNIML